MWRNWKEGEINKYNNDRLCSASLNHFFDPMCVNPHAYVHLFCLSSWQQPWYIRFDQVEVDLLHGALLSTRTNIKQHEIKLRFNKLFLQFLLLHLVVSLFFLLFFSFIFRWCGRMRFFSLGSRRKYKYFFFVATLVFTYFVSISSSLYKRYKLCRNMKRREEKSIGISY